MPAFDQGAYHIDYYNIQEDMVNRGALTGKAEDDSHYMFKRFNDKLFETSVVDSGS